MKRSTCITIGMFFCAFVSTLFAADYGGGLGTADYPYLISTPEQMNTIGANSGDWGKCFKLTNNIDMGAYTGTQYKIIGMNSAAYFTGTFDGDGYVISNLTYYKATAVAYFGVFGYTSHATIKNVGLANVNITAKGSYVGALVGYQLSGTITDCYSTGTVVNSSTSTSYAGGLIGYNASGPVTSCYSTCNVSGNTYVGGLAGGNTGAMTLCWAAGTATGTSNYVGGLVGYNPIGTVTSCYATGDVTGYNYVGGLVGESNNGSTILSCSAAGAVTGNDYVGGLAGDGETMTLCSATGTVSGGSYAGGLVGYHSAGVITSSYAAGDVSGTDYVGGLTGRNFGTITSCYAMGIVTGTGDSAGGLAGYNLKPITACYSAGAVSGVSNVGGFCGYSSGAITNCFWDMQTSGWTLSSGGTGKTTDQMMALSTFTSATWDFTNETANGMSNFWRMCAGGVDYPRLSWESAVGDLGCPNGVATDDFAWLSQNWLLTTCTADNNYCGGADMDYSGSVGIEDFVILAEHWLEGI